MEKMTHLGRRRCCVFVAFNVCTTLHVFTLHITDLKILLTTRYTVYNCVHSCAHYKPLCTQALAPGLMSGTHPRGNTALAYTFVCYCTSLHRHYSTALQITGITLPHFTTLSLLYCISIHCHYSTVLHYTVITLLQCAEIITKNSLYCTTLQ